MLLIAGTVPDEAFPLIVEPVRITARGLALGERIVDIARGTPALAAAAAQAASVLGDPPPTACLAGDIGRGQGSRRIYDYLAQNLNDVAPSVLAFHYLQPEVDGHLKVLLSVQEMQRRPLLIADAGFMYAAKMSGQAKEYDLFTPDAGELAFLADEEAPHPFYTRGFILHGEASVPEMMERAYRGGNAARYLLVKGATDYVANRRSVLHTLSEPNCAAMEAIGGTGDIVTGLAAALMLHGLDIPKAALTACLASRLAGKFAEATPASQAADIIEHAPKALEAALKQLFP